MAQATKLETEARYWFKLARAQAAALRSGDAAALSEARDDMEAMQMHAHNPQIKARAARALAAI